MTARIFRIELWRSPARWLALLSLPLLIFGYQDAARGLTVPALDQRQLLMLFGPLAVGVAAWHARRDRRSRMQELLATTARPRWQRMLPQAAVLSAATVCGGIVVLVGASIFVALAGGYFSAAALPIAFVGALILLIPVALGLVLGRWLPFPLIAPLVVILMPASLAFIDTEGYDVPPGWLLLSGSLEAHSSMSSEFAAVTAKTHVAQGFWALGLIAAGVLAFVGAGLRSRVAALAAAVIGAAVAIPLLPDRYADAFYVDPAATAQVCTTDEPRVCVTRVHRAALDDLREPARRALATLAAKLPSGAPTSVAEVPDVQGDPPRSRPDTVSVGFAVTSQNRSAYSESDLFWTLLSGAGTLPCANAPAWGTPERLPYDVARVVAAAWLAGEEPPSPQGRPLLWWLPDRAAAQQVYAALLALPADEQKRRIAALRQAELACDGSNRIELLTGRA